MRRTAAVAALVLGSLLLIAPSASAAGCEQAPVPTMPDRGISGQLLATPANPPTAVGPGITYFEVYGPAAQFATDQSGCVQAVVDAVTGGAATTTQEASSGQTLANWIMLGPEWGVAATAALADAAFNTNGWLTVLDPLWVTIGGALMSAITTPLAPFVAVVVLLVLAFALIRGKIGAFVGTLGVALAATALITLGGTMPVKAGHATDAVIVSSSTSLRQAINGTSNPDPGVALVGALSDQIVYRSWCAGELGSSDSITASRYCPRLYAASHLTWAEAATVRKDPDALKALVEAKQDDWTTAAGDLKNEDPDAYRNLTGDNGSNRVAQAMNALITWGVALPMILVSLVLVVAAFLLIRIIVVSLPVLGLLMVVPKFHRLLPSIGATAAAAVINAVVFSGVASTTALVTTFVMGSSLIPWPLRLLLCLAFTVVVWVVTKPFRKLTRMVGNWDPMQQMHQVGDRFAASIKGTLNSAVGAAVGAAAGVKIANGDGAGAQEAEAAEATTREPQTYRRHATRPDIATDPTLALPAGEPVTVPQSLGAAPVSRPATDLAVVKRPTTQAATERPAVNPYPGPVTVDGVTVHDRRDPRVGDVPEFEAGAEGTFVVFDSEHGLVEVDADEEANA